MIQSSTMQLSIPMTPEESRQQTLALAANAIAVAAWGLSNVAIKLVSASGLVTSFYRLWFAIPLLWLVALGMPSLRRRLDRHWLKACIIGGVLFAGHQICFFNAVKLTNIANVSIIGALQPALVLLVAGRLFGEVSTRRSLAWAGVAFAAIIPVIVGAAGMPSWSPAGDLLAFVNVVVFTAYFLASKQARRHLGTAEYILGMTTVAGIVILLVCITTGQELTSPRGWDWSVLLFLALVPGTIGHYLSNWAHRHSSAFVMSVMLLGVPVIAAALAAIVLDEQLTPLQLLGGATVLAAVGQIVRGASGARGVELAEGAAKADAP
jgi:drug/metabolite transporter (DMT)-like permease